MSRRLRRRGRALLHLARDCLLLRGAGAPYAPVAFASLAALAFLLTDARELGWRLAPALALFVAAALIGLFDARYFLIPDGPLVWLIGAGVADIVFFDPAAAMERLLAAGVAYGFFFVVARAYQALRGAAGLGQGDFALFAAAGLWLGPRGLPSALFVAAVSALLSALIAFRGAAGAKAREPIPFGPHLMLGLWLVFAIGPLEAG